MVRKRVGPRNYTMMGVICQKCNSDFKCPTFEVKRGNGKFCSRYCQRSYQAIVNAENNDTGVSRKERTKIWANNVAEEVLIAHRAVKSAIRNGVLVREPCEVCGKEKVDAHHDDYSKPLDVRWLCRFHHLKHHRGF